VAVGPNGEDISGDFGVHWKHTDSLNLNAVALLDIWTGWAVGANGTIARFVNHYGYEIRYRQPHGRQQPLAATCLRHCRLNPKGVLCRVEMAAQ
jgi:hypothetical protein